MAQREPAGCISLRAPGEPSSGFGGSSGEAAEREERWRAANAVGAAGEPNHGTFDTAAVAAGADGSCNLESILRRNEQDSFEWDPLAFHSNGAHYLRIFHLVAALVVAIGGFGYTLFSCTHIMHSALKYAVD